MQPAVAHAQRLKGVRNALCGVKFVCNTRRRGLQYRDQRFALSERQDHEIRQ
jgi:hypothetical protein